MSDARSSRCWDRRPRRRLRADRPVLRAHRQLRQRRALGAADRRPLGHGVLQRPPAHPRPATVRRICQSQARPTCTRAWRGTQASSTRRRWRGVVLFLVLRWATHRAKWLQRPGAVTGLWLIGYGADPHRARERAQSRRRHAQLPARPDHGHDPVDADDRSRRIWLLWRAFRQPAQPPTAEARVSLKDRLRGGDRRRGADRRRRLHGALPARSRWTATTRPARRSARRATSSPRRWSRRCSAS